MANTAALAKLDVLEKKYADVKGKLSTFRSKAKSSVNHTMRTATVAGGGFLGGAAEAYFENGEIFGFAAPLAVGAAGVALAYFLDDDAGAGGHVRSAADGALAYYAGYKGKEMVADWIAKGPKGAGTRGERGARGLNQREFDSAFT